MKLLLFVLAISAILLGPVALNVAYSAAIKQALAPGDTLTVTCPTSLSGTLSAVSCATPVPSTPAPSLVWLVPQMTPLGQSTGYDPGSSPAASMFQCGGWWTGQDDENTYAVVQFPKPTPIYGVNFGSYAWNGTGVLGTTGVMWLRNAGLLTEPGSDGRPLWHNNLRGDNDAGGGWSNDGLRANQIAPAFPNGASGLTFDIPWNHTTYYTFTFAPVTVTMLRVELMDIGGGGSFTTLVGGLHILTSAGTPKAC
jgi:hypothetical protein